MHSDGAEVGNLRPLSWYLGVQLANRMKQNTRRIRIIE